MKWSPCLLFPLFVVPACALAAEAMLSVPVRVLGAPTRPEGPSMQARATRSEPPPIAQGLLPQYESRRAFDTDVAGVPDRQERSLRFWLAIPDQLLLLEVAVTIDGLPFESIREQRITRLLAELENPSVGKAIPPAGTDGKERTSGGAQTTETADDAAADILARPPGQEADEPNASDDQTQIEPITLPGNGLSDRLRRYAQVTGRPPSRAELRWLLTKWINGPTLMLLDRNFQRFRGAQQPALAVLDRDLDGTISQAEIHSAARTLTSCDINQNDVVEFTEIATVAGNIRRAPTRAGPVAVIPLSDATSVAKAFRRLAEGITADAARRRWDHNLDGVLDEAEFLELSQSEPDLTLAVSFNSSDASKSSLTISAVSSQLDGRRSRLVGPSITLAGAGTCLEFSAVQSTASQETDQISVGVVNDGYPILPVLDPNGDGRLTIRELRRVSEYLRRLDENQDGSITRGEIIDTVRVAFGLGPNVHQHLSDIRSVHPPSASPTVEVPGWFTEMDANRDGDISRREFLLGADKFQELDTDNDGLISSHEVSELKRGKEQTAPKSKPEKAASTP